MPGVPLSSATVDNDLSSLAVRLRDVMNDINEFAQEINTAGSAGLQSAGYSSADATTVLQAVAYMSNVSGCYFGTVQQGGSGGTGAILFNFNTALSAYWAANLT